MRRKIRRQRQRKRQWLRACIVHSWYISSPSSAKQQREMTNLCIDWRTRATMANFSFSYLVMSVFVAYLAGASFNTDKYTGLI